MDPNPRAEAAEFREANLRKLILDSCTPANERSWPCFHYVKFRLHAQWRQEDGQLSPLLTPEQALDATLEQQADGY